MPAGVSSLAAAMVPLMTTAPEQPPPRMQQWILQPAAASSAAPARHLSSSSQQLQPQPRFAVDSGSERCAALAAAPEEAAEAFAARSAGGNRPIPQFKHLHSVEQMWLLFDCGDKHRPPLRLLVDKSSDWRHSWRQRWHEFLKACQQIEARVVEQRRSGGPNVTGRMVARQMDAERLSKGKKDKAMSVASYVRQLVRSKPQ